jgi:hypothetical protein
VSHEAEGALEFAEPSTDEPAIVMPLCSAAVVSPNAEMPAQALMLTASVS